VLRILDTWREEREKEERRGEGCGCEGKRGGGDVSVEIIQCETHQQSLEPLTPNSR
jgi:hypothetical protein